jgi:pimeloyl-ACP methyl ester carboxylesterase
MSTCPEAEARRRAAAAILASFRLAPADGGLEHATRGNGFPVVALHGGLGGWDQSALLGHLVFRDLPVRLIAVSRPGHLGSPLRLGRGAAEQAEAVVRLLDRLGIDRAIVAAISGGGPTALALAERHPTRVAGLVLVSAATDRLAPNLPFRFRAMRILARLPFVLRRLAARDAADPTPGDLHGLPDPDLRARVVGDPDTAAALSALRASLFDRMAERLAGLDNDLAVCAAQTTPGFAAVDVPTLLVHAVDDPVVPHGMSVALADAIPGAELLSLPSGGHMALFAHRAAIAARAAAFFGRVAQAAGAMWTCTSEGRAV